MLSDRTTWTIGRSSSRRSTTAATAKFSYRKRTLMPGSDMHRSMDRCGGGGHRQTTRVLLRSRAPRGARPSLGQCVLHRPAREFCATSQAGLLADAREVVLHGARRDVQLLGDLLVRTAARDEAQDLVLALAQQRAD